MQPFSLTSSKKIFLLWSTEEEKRFFLFCSKVHFRSSFFLFFFFLQCPKMQSADGMCSFCALLLFSPISLPRKKKKKANKIPAVFLRQGKRIETFFSNFRFTTRGFPPILPLE